MKRIFYTVLAVTAVSMVMSSCSKLLSPREPSSYAEPEDGKFDVNFKFVSAAGQESKAIQEAQESKINEVQIFVFDSTRNDMLETYYKGNAVGGKLRLTPGKKKIRALANAPALGSGVGKLSDLDSAMSEFGVNTADNFVMSGSLSVEIKSDATLPIVVRRHAAKIILKQVRTAFSAPVYADAKFVINDIYLTNVAVKCKYFGLPYTNTEWNKGYGITKDMGLNKEVSDNKYDTEHIFYAYPNSSEDKPTRLVLKTTLGGTVSYYPIDLGKIESNKIYSVSDLLVTRPGGDDEDIPVVSGEFPYTVTVNGWDSDVTQLEEII